jgi:hypothetical protein
MVIQILMIGNFYKNIHHIIVSCHCCAFVCSRIIIIQIWGMFCDEHEKTIAANSLWPKFIFLVHCDMTPKLHLTTLCSNSIILTLTDINPDADYPPILVTTSTRDDRVHPAHARKFVKVSLFFIFTSLPIPSKIYIICCCQWRRYYSYMFVFHFSPVYFDE